MPRIRTIKPEFWPDEKLCKLDPVTRLVFLGLISMADDCGRVLDNRKLIDAFIFPDDEDTVTSREALATLSRIGRILRGQTASGQRVIQIVNWTKHQKVDRPNLLSSLPELVSTDVDTDIRDTLATDSRGPREALATDSRYDLRPTTYDLGSTTNDQEREIASAREFDPPPNSDLQVQTIWEAYPTANRTPRCGVVPPEEAEAIIDAIVRDGYEPVLIGTLNYRDAYAKWPPGEKRYIRPIRAFYSATDRDYDKKPEYWQRDTGNGHGRQPALSDADERSRRTKEKLAAGLTARHGDSWMAGNAVTTNQAGGSRGNGAGTVVSQPVILPPGSN